MNKAQQLLKDANVKPTAEIIANGLGATNNTYTKFIDRLKKYDISLMDWRYYNDGKVWLSKGEYKWITKRGTNKVNPIFWLSIWEGFFKISFFFSVSVKDELLALPISQEAKKLIKNANPMGKTMRFIPIIFDVDDAKQLGDLFVLAQFRKDNL
jgi:hypothetical protein